MKEQLWNANYIKIMAVNALMYFAFYILTPLLPLYLADHFGAENDTIGIVLSGYTLVALFVRPFSGFLIDSYDRRRVLMVCLALFFLFFGGYIAAGSLLMFAIVRTLHGGPFGAMSVADSTVAIDVLPSSRRNEGIGYYGLSTNFALAFGPMVGIWLYKLTHNFATLFWAAFAMSLLGLLLASTIHIPTKTIVKNKSKLSLDRFFLTRGWLLAVNILLFGFCYGVLANYLAIYSQQQLGITNGTGVYFALLSLGLACSRLQGAKGLREGRITRNCGEGVLISIIGYTLFAACPNELCYYLSALIIGLGNGHMYPAFLNMFIAVAHHNERGTANSSILTSWDLGFGIGILAGGLVSKAAGYAAAFWMVDAMQIAGAILFLAATRRFLLGRQLKE